jgi:stage V sporulation protein G
VVITEVRIKLMDDNNENERLQAFCSVTFDDAYVVRDLKIIEGTKGSFVAMPSRKLTDRCPGCGSKNHLRARFCNACGGKLDEDRATRDADGRVKLHADIAHPINSACREVIQSAIIKAFREEKDRSKQPGYVCTYDDFDSDYEPATAGAASYGQVVSEMGAAPRGYRTHGSHGARGAHTTVQATTAAARQEKRPDGFGAGIL